MMVWPDHRRPIVIERKRVAIVVNPPSPLAENAAQRFADLRMAGMEENDCWPAMQLPGLP
jgi:hypothetical protein